MTANERGLLLLEGSHPIEENGRIPKTVLIEKSGQCYYTWPRFLLKRYQTYTKEIDFARNEILLQIQTTMIVASSLQKLLLILAFLDCATGFSLEPRSWLQSIHQPPQAVQNSPLSTVQAGFSCSRTRTNNAGLNSVSKRNKDASSDKDTALYYNDDCFGLIFLSTGLVAHDAVFAACFALVSGLAATYYNKNNTDLDAKLQTQFPAAVAGLTLLFVAPVTRVVLQPQEWDFLPARVDFAAPLEIGVCAFSVLYALYRTEQLKQQQS